MLKDYSEKEIEFFKSINLYKLIDSDLNPINVYYMAAEKAFLENWNNNKADSLRNCLKALKGFKTFRKTKEWDEMLML